MLIRACRSLSKSGLRSRFHEKQAMVVLERSLSPDLSDSREALEFAADSLDSYTATPAPHTDFVT